MILRAWLSYYIIFVVYRLQQLCKVVHERGERIVQCLQTQLVLQHRASEAAQEVSGIAAHSALVYMYVFPRNQNVPFLAPKKTWTGRCLELKFAPFCCSRDALSDDYYSCNPSFTISIP